MKVGRIKIGACNLYNIAMYKKYANEIPEKQDKFGDIILKLEGQLFFIDKIDENRIILKYPKSMTFTVKENGYEVRSINLHTDLVDVFKIIKGDD